MNPRVATAALSLVITSIGGCAPSPKPIPYALKNSGFYWLPERFANGDAVYVQSKACGRATRDVAVAVHQRPPAGYSGLIFRPAAGSSPEEISCIVTALDGKPHMMLDMPDAQMRPPEEPAK